MVKLSVIMPVYNVGSYLDTAIRSVLAQTVDLELLIINDGSTDNSLAVAQSYQEDARVKIITIPNSGLSEARNVGIKNATGEFYYFMDSDDALLKNALSEILKKIETHHLDGISFSYEKADDDVFDKKTDATVGETNSFKILNTQEALNLLMLSKIPQMAWSYIFKASIFSENHILFSKGRLFEDNNSAPKIFEHAPQIELVEFQRAPYLYRSRKGSITDKNLKRPSQKALDDEYYVFTDAYSIYKRNDISQADLWYFNKLVHLWIKYRMNQESGTDEKLFTLKNKAQHLLKQVKSDLSLRDRWRYMRMSIAGLDKVIRFLLGEKK